MMLVITIAMTILVMAVLLMSVGLWRLQFDRNRIKQVLAECKAELETSKAQCIVLKQDKEIIEAKLNLQSEAHAAQGKMLQQTKEQLKSEFQNTAHQLLKEKSKDLSNYNDKELRQLLQPFREQVQAFSTRVNEIYDRESKDRTALSEQINHLKTLNLKISKEAVDLTQALKGQVKIQGNWGEMILERVLETSGLEKGREFDTQVDAVTNEEGQRLRPDVVVRLPQKRDIVIDAKVSLLAYERFCNADCEKDRETALSQHIVSIRQHVKGLSVKGYQKLTNLNSLDFVLLFIPIESAFSVAVEEDQKLIVEALAANIMIVTPTTLLATLRTIQNMWRLEWQAEHSKEIAHLAGRLYDQFVGFVTEFEKIGQRIDSTQKAYQSAFTKLSAGRVSLVAQTEKLKKMGANTSKKLPESVLEH